MILLIDNYDSFTYNLADSIRQAGVGCEVVRNDSLSVKSISPKKYSGIVISPGPKKPAEAGITMDVINAFHQSIPILGVCLGHQAIGVVYPVRKWRQVLTLFLHCRKVQRRIVGVVDADAEDRGIHQVVDAFVDRLDDLLRRERRRDRLPDPAQQLDVLFLLILGLERRTLG
mgnify:CR=1 FL=1